MARKSTIYGTTGHSLLGLVCLREYQWVPPCFSRGKQRFSVAQKSTTLITRFRAGFENPGLKPIPKIMNCFSAGLKSSSPLLKQGAPTGSHADTSAPHFVVAGAKARSFLRG